MCCLEGTIFPIGGKCLSDGPDCCLPGQSVYEPGDRCCLESETCCPPDKRTYCSASFLVCVAPDHCCPEGTDALCGANSCYNSAEKQCCTSSQGPRPCNLDKTCQRDGRCCPSGTLQCRDDCYTIATEHCCGEARCSLGWLCCADECCQFGVVCGSDGSCSRPEISTSSSIATTTTSAAPDASSDTCKIGAASRPDIVQRQIQKPDTCETECY